MNICIEFEHSVSNDPLLIEVAWPEGHTTLNLQQEISTLHLNFDLPIKNQTVELMFSCNNLDIINHPLTITNIVLDEFFSFSKILYSGIPIFDQLFIQHAEKNNMFIDTSVVDCNRIDFTGKLCYQFSWPFYKNVFR
jgi:hypothetical protein